MNLCDVKRVQEQNYVKLSVDDDRGRLFRVSQTLEDINLYSRHYRSIEHRLKSNNWLKLHKMVMRRKPFKLEKRYMMIDEAHLIFRD